MCTSPRPKTHFDFDTRPDERQAHRDLWCRPMSQRYRIPTRSRPVALLKLRISLLTPLMEARQSSHSRLSRSKASSISLGSPRGACAVSIDSTSHSVGHGFRTACEDEAQIRLRIDRIEFRGANEAVGCGGTFAAGVCSSEQIIIAVTLTQHNRRNWMFDGSLRAGRRAAAVISLVQSAKMNGHDSYVYLKDVLERLPVQPVARLDERLPQH